LKEQICECPLFSFRLKPSIVNLNYLFKRFEFVGYTAIIG